jgi:hypothetical protein
MRTTAGSKRLLIPIIVAPLLMAGYMATCGKQGLPECPHDWDFSKIQVVGKKTRELETLQTFNGSPLLSGPQVQTNVPEFNDCQRLVKGSGKTAQYDSLYAVWARDSMADTLSIKTVLDTGAAFPMVEILSLGGTSPQLELEPGFSCLFVFKQGNRWFAKLVAFGPKEDDCHSARSLESVMAYPALSIKRTSASDMGLKWKDFPAVARWDWDVKSNTQVIGFGCLDGWCEVGELGHDPRTTEDLSTTMTSIAGLSGSPVLKVKGWYDEQRLSPTKSHWWKPGAGPGLVVGTIVPAPGLDQVDASSFDQTWQAIAYVNLSAPSSEYYDQQGFAPIQAGSVTTISLCMEDWGGADPPPTGRGCPEIAKELRQAATCAPEASTPTIHWWAKTVPADNPHPRYWCIVRRSAPAGVPVPGTARWRWLADDETTWGRCGGACCSGH